MYMSNFNLHSLLSHAEGLQTEQLLEDLESSIGTEDWQKDLLSAMSTELEGLRIAALTQGTMPEKMKAYIIILLNLINKQNLEFNEDLDSDIYAGFLYKIPFNKTTAEFLVSYFHSITRQSESLREFYYEVVLNYLDFLRFMMMSNQNGDLDIIA